MTREDATERVAVIVNAAVADHIPEDLILRAVKAARLWAAVNEKGLEDQVQFLERTIARMMATT